MFEAVPTKLPHYILPAYPALAMMMAAFVAMPKPQDAPRWWRMLPAVSAAQFLVGTALLAAALVVLPRLYGSGTSWDLMGGRRRHGRARRRCGGGDAARRHVGRGAARRRRGAGDLLGGDAGRGAEARPALGQPARGDDDRGRMPSRATRRRCSPATPSRGAMFLIGTETRLTNGYGAAEIGAAQGRPRRGRGRTAPRLPGASRRARGRRRRHRLAFGLQLLARPAGRHYALSHHPRRTK